MIGLTGARLETRAASHRTAQRDQHALFLGREGGTGRARINLLRCVIRDPGVLTSAWLRCRIQALEEA